MSSRAVNALPRRDPSIPTGSQLSMTYVTKYGLQWRNQPELAVGMNGQVSYSLFFCLYVGWIQLILDIIKLIDTTIHNTRQYTAMHGGMRCKLRRYYFFARTESPRFDGRRRRKEIFAHGRTAEMISTHERTVQDSTDGDDEKRSSRTDERWRWCARTNGRSKIQRTATTKRDLRARTNGGDDLHAQTDGPRFDGRWRRKKIFADEQRNGGDDQHARTDDPTAWRSFVEEGALQRGTDHTTIHHHAMRESNDDGDQQRWRRRSATTRHSNDDGDQQWWGGERDAATTNTAQGWGQRWGGGR